MTLPSLTVTGRYDSAVGTPQAGAVLFTPSAAVEDAAGRVVISAVPNTAALNTGGSFSIVLPCTDSAGLVPAGWLYNVDVAVPGAQQTFTTYLPLALGGTAGTVDITALAPVTGTPSPSGVAYLPNATSPPSSGPSGGGGFLYSLGGVLYWINGDNTPVVVGPGSGGYGGIFAPAGDLGGTDASPTVVSAHLASPLPQSQGGLGNTSGIAANVSGTVATINGGTGSGTQNWTPLLTPTAVQSGTVTAAAGQMVLMSTASTAGTINFPHAPSGIVVIGAKLVTYGTANTVTIYAAGGDTFSAGAGTTATLKLLDEGGIWQYDGALTTWVKQSDDLPLSQLDARYAQLTGATMTGGLVTQTPVIVFDGDSLTVGQGTLPYNNFPNGNDYPSQIVGSLDHRGSYYNIGVGGETAAIMLANAPTNVDTKHVAGANNVVCFEGGTNDLYNGVSAATLEATIVSYCQGRQAAGFKVIVATIVPRSDAGTPGGFETARQAVNTYIRTNWTSWANGLADVGNDANIGQAGDQANTQYYNGDNVHPNSNGYRIFAGYFLTALGNLGIIGETHGDLAALVSDVWVPANEFVLSSGSPTQSAANLWSCWNMNHAETDAIVGSVLLPRDWLSYNAQIAWTQTAGGTGNVAWRLDSILNYTGGTASTVAVGAQTNVAVPSASILSWFAPTGANYNANQGDSPRIVTGFRVARLGSAGQDTYTSAAQFTGLYLYRAT